MSSWERTISHIKTTTATRYPWYVKLLSWLQRRRYARELEPTRLWGRTPRTFLAMSVMYATLDRRSSPLPPALRSLNQVRVSQVIWCAFCVDANAAAGLKRHVREERLDALQQFAESTLFDDREKAALHYAEAMTDSDRHSDPALMTTLQGHFSDDTIIELIALIAFQNKSNIINATLGVPAHGYCSAAIT